MVAKDEGDTEEEQQEGDQEDQGELLLQVGQPAGLATPEQDKDEALPTGWMKL